MKTNKQDRRVLYLVQFSEPSNDYIYLSKAPKKLPINAKLYKVVKTIQNGIISKRQITR